MASGAIRAAGRLAAEPSRLALGWCRHVTLLASICLAILLLFARDARDMAAIWWSASTFQHCLFIPPIVAWLVWQRREGLARIAPRGWTPGLLIVAAGASGWLLGDDAGVALARHLGLVMMMQGCVATILGPAATRALLFPLCYCLFLVPAGEGLVPPLQSLTARMSMGLLALGGMPARLDGVFITTPQGWFEIAEACSGVKFLIAMVAYGALVANVCFARWPRRIAFMVVAVVVPIVANGLRSWATIYVASLTSVDVAGHFDHVVYGWVFFGAVIAATMALGWRHFDRRPGDPWFDPARLDPAPRKRRPALALALGCVAVAAAPLVWARAVSAATPLIERRLALPTVAGWTRVRMADRVPWRPAFPDPDHSLIGRYRDAAGHEADLAIIVYVRQAEGRELVGYGHGATGPDSGWTWSRDTAPPPMGRAERILAPGGLVREVASFYRIGDVTTGSDVSVKLETLKVRLTGGDQRATAVLVSGRGPAARASVDAFLRDLGPIDRLVARTLDPATR